MNRESTRHKDAAVFDVYLEDAGIDKREREARVELQDVVRYSGLNLGHVA